MIITISGTAGTGKSTVGKIIAKQLGMKHYSNGDFMRNMAEEKKISLLELTKQAETDRGIDEELDQRQIMLGRNEDNFIIDSRLGFHFIPNSIKIFLDADLDIRAKRILADTIRIEHNVNMENTKRNMETRETSEKKRYNEYYSINPYDKTNYDHIIDTSHISAEEAADKIIKIIKEH